MAIKNLRVTVDSQYHKWEAGFARLGSGEIPHSAVRAWEDACEVYYGATQQYVHVISGDLKKSGRMHVHREASRVVGEISYAGKRRSKKHGLVDYTWYEVRRGGSHDFFRRAFVKSAPIMEEMAALMVGRALKELMD